MIALVTQLRSLFNYAARDVSAFHSEIHSHTNKNENTFSLWVRIPYTAKITNITSELLLIRIYLFHVPYIFIKLFLIRKSTSI